MTKHYCNKETEIQKIKDDVGYIRKAISGNGEPGLTHEVLRNTKFRHQAMASLALIKWLLAFSIGSFLVSVFNFII